MINKVGGLARVLYILLAIVAAFVPLGGLNVALVLLVLGLIAGLSMPRERMVLAGVILIALPIVGTALGTLPAIGAQLAAITVNLQMALAGAMATAIAMLCYDLVMEGVGGMTGTGAATGGSTAAAS
ncbi:hypothetical protein [Sphingomonas daechungensis]|uniref:hypothetical protein n=1 Tax=Sphingomonas daechungensis TaxID=1176646 RepID=UPI00378417F2